MNWNPLKRLSLLRHKPELDSTTQNASEQLERLVAEFDSAENVSKSLQQAAKKLLNQILCMGKSEMTLTEHVASAPNALSNDASLRNVLEEWNSFACVNNTIGDEYAISLRKTLIEPLKELNQAFVELRAQIRLHDAVQLDVIRFQRKVASYNDKDKTGANLVKLQETKEALAASQTEFAKQTQQLVNDLTKFLSGSVEMLKPLLEGFIAAEVAWVQASKRLMDHRSHIVTSAQVKSQSERLKSIEDTFEAMNGLSICSSHDSK